MTVWILCGAVVVSGLAALAAGLGPEVLLGGLAPAIAGAGSWWVTTRTWAADPAALFRVMMRAFVAKCAFFVAWVVIMLRGFEVRPVPFALSLTVAFLGLHLTEAWSLRRLMQPVLERGRSGGPTNAGRIE